MLRTVESRLLGAGSRTNFKSKIIWMRWVHRSADIVVSGGGLVGATCAAAIAKLEVTKNKNIVLLESSQNRPIKLGAEYSNRVAALNPGSVQLLERIGAWKIIEEHRFNPVHNMRVWESLSDASISFSNPDGTPLNYLVENDLTQLALNSVLETCSNLTVVYGAKAEKYTLPNPGKESIPEEKVLIHLENGDTVETDLIIGADGFRSQVRQSLGCESMSWEYDCMGVVATLELEQETLNHTAFQRFLPTGPIAILPLSPKYSSLVWSLPTKQAKAKMGLSDDEFLASLRRNLLDTSNLNPLVNSASAGLNLILQSFGDQAKPREVPHKIKGVKNRAGFPLGFSHSTRYIGPRTVIIGDAAHRVHPLAGQGVNLGFGDVETISRIIDESIRDGAGLGNRSYLREYETERQRHNVPTMFSIDSLHRLYSSSFTPIVLARTFGVQITDSLGPLKKALMSHAASG
jgi:ubiquinone biosynthesis monooxygenase Coq6